MFWNCESNRDKYRRQTLCSGDWTPVAAGHAKDYNFFKVTVETK